MKRPISFDGFDSIVSTDAEVEVNFSRIDEKLGNV